jgi:hypothetical protein
VVGLEIGPKLPDFGNLIFISSAIPKLFPNLFYPCGFVLKLDMGVGNVGNAERCRH